MHHLSIRLLLPLVFAIGCSRTASPPVRSGTPVAPWRASAAQLAADLERSGIRDPAVLAAIRSVPRHRFIPGDPPLELAYGDHPLPIGHEQTISQPYVVAFMTEAARLDRRANVLEVGTGSGYAAAVAAEVLGLGPEPAGEQGGLVSIEIIPELAERADRVLKELGYREVAVRAGDGYRGWPDRAPFDAILVTAAPDHIPEPLKQQLAVDGRLVLPVGTGDQQIVRITRTSDGGFIEEKLLPVRFVPMTGEAQEKR